MKIELKPLQCVTSAPEDYDYGWAKTLIENLYKDENKTFRLVEVEDEWHFQQQIMRYGSGMNLTLDTQKTLDEFIQYGHLRETPDPRIIYRGKFEFKEVLNWGDERREKLLALIEEIRAFNQNEVILKTESGGLKYSLTVIGNENLFNVLSNRLNNS